MARVDGSRHRVDVLVEDLGDCVSVVEIKNTGWDRMKPHRVRPNALRHAAQVWGYVEPWLDRARKDVVPGIIYRKVPKIRDRLNEIEECLHSRGIQVVWHEESVAACKLRNQEA